MRQGLTIVLLHNLFGTVIQYIAFVQRVLEEPNAYGAALKYKYFDVENFVGKNANENKEHNFEGSTFFINLKDFSSNSPVK